MSDTTTDELRNALRSVTGVDDLDWATPPTPLHGGFWAEMYTVELVEVATWEAGNQLDHHAGHPWLQMRQTLDEIVGTPDNVRRPHPMAT